jgi:hypothetical protein
MYAASFVRNVCNRNTWGTFWRTGYGGAADEHALRKTIRAAIEVTLSNLCGA